MSKVLKLLPQISFFLLIFMNTTSQSFLIQSHAVLNPPTSGRKFSTSSFKARISDQGTQTHSVYHTFVKPETPQNELFTCNFQFVTSDFSLQINPSSLLCVVHATEAWDVYHTLLVNVHVTGCGHKNGSDTHEKLKIYWKFNKSEK